MPAPAAPPGEPSAPGEPSPPGEAPGLLGVPSTSHRSAGANGTNHGSGTDHPLVWMYTRADPPRLSHFAKLSAAAAACRGANASDSGAAAVDWSVRSASQDRSRVCHGQM